MPAWRGSCIGASQPLPAISPSSVKSMSKVKNSERLTLQLNVTDGSVALFHWAGIQIGTLALIWPGVSSPDLHRIELHGLSKWTIQTQKNQQAPCLFAYTTPRGCSLAVPCTHACVTSPTVNSCKGQIFHFLCNLLQCCSQRPNKCPLHEGTCRDKKYFMVFPFIGVTILLCFVIGLYIISF